MTIDEQIAAVQEETSFLAGCNSLAMHYAILASLERLKKIDEVRVPEQLEFTRADDFLPTTYVVRRTEYDTLRDLLKREIENREHH